MSIVSLLASLISFNVWIYSALKFLLGFFRSSVGTCTLVLLVEKVGKKWRFKVGILAFVCFAIGFLTLPAMAYLNRDSLWTFLYLWSSIIGLCYSVCVHFFVSESPRWLIMQGREEEAMRILSGGDAKLASRLLELPSKQEAFSNSGGMYSSIGRIFGKKWSLKRISAVMVLAFGIGMVYFGMPLGVGNLGFNIYLGVALNALLEMLTYIVTYLLENSKRRISLLSFTTLSGVFSILLCGGVVVSLRVEALKMVLELASFFCACSASNVMLIYTMELFPTCVRNTATALVRQAIVLGAIFGPILASEGRKSDSLSYGVFGGVIMVCGFSVAFLPETHGTILCDTMDQQENKESIVEVAELKVAVSDLFEVERNTTESIDDYLIRFKNFLNLAQLADKVQQIEKLNKEKEEYESSTSKEQEFVNVNVTSIDYLTEKESGVKTPFATELKLSTPTPKAKRSLANKKST
ncbi:hypothetical protein PIB30_102705 [Stylosanthes scabra]|uniref:Major facilitator superfamily (MFS) profile domain-containing protein n=1 Tax=Stylosanthes scabra TaxID=79078 RepID=A0ABU6QX76_9FABA|nr:hypothetical protein [Stylosanthes scabra]